MPYDPLITATLIHAVWDGDPRPRPAPDALASSLVLARVNDVDGPFIRAYGKRLPDELAALDESVAGYRHNLATACGLLTSAGVEPILIKAHPADDVTYSNFDLVVGDDGWDAAVAALTPWSIRRSRYPLEPATKLLLYPETGPAVHLHRSVSWFDIPVIPNAGLRSRALPDPTVPCLLPAPVDALRIQLAHAVFQNQALTLGELLAIRHLLEPSVVEPSRRLATDEGWEMGFGQALTLARDAVDRLDHGDPIRLPCPLPVLGALAAGLEHAIHLARSSRPMLALREVALRPAIVAAKQRRLRLA